MKERGLIRIIILLSGALLWVAYLFDAVCSRYAIYEVIGYGAHELLSMLPYVSALATAVWLAITLVKGARGKDTAPGAGVLWGPGCPAGGAVGLSDRALPPLHRHRSGPGHRDGPCAGAGAAGGDPASGGV